LWGGCST